MKRSLYRLIQFIKLRAPWRVIWMELRLLCKKLLQSIGLWRYHRNPIDGKAGGAELEEKRPWPKR
jgi:hypothetical protein